MSVIAAPTGFAQSRAVRRSAAGFAGMALIAALSLATLSRSGLGGAIGRGVGDTIHGVQTVAAMLAERSPGERPEGALANLKHKRQAVLHERALPKVRGPGSPAYQALAGPPPSPAVAPPGAPLYNVVAGGPPVAIPPTAAVTPGTPGGPPVLSNIPLPGGGGGGFLSPPVTAATPDVPPVPVAPVPEPATWAMMILGFVLIGRTLRRTRVAGPKPTLE